jgi:hypothetical protein
MPRRNLPTTAASAFAPIATVAEPAPQRLPLSDRPFLFSAVLLPAGTIACQAAGFTRFSATAQ